ncbi:MAG: outer membrane lipoprotein carrier protein LolA [Proteobacteria bacterium]|nr:outer membrane lipoprotein carrier protein LolA [Pseudomonadota bacterium]
MAVRRRGGPPVRLPAALLLLVLPTIAAAAAPGGDFDALMQLLATRHQGHVPYTEVHEMAMLQEPLRSSGELFYQAPDHLEKRTLTPRAESLVLDHGVLTARRGTRTHVLELAAYPQIVPFVESIRATLAGDRAALEHHFQVGFSGDLAHWTLELTPRDPAVAGTVQRITLEGTRDAIQTVTIRQSDGDRSVVSIGPEIPP